MSLLDELKQMKRKGRHVVSIDFVLDSLRESQRHETVNSTSLEVGTRKTPYDGTGDFWEGVD